MCKKSQLRLPTGASCFCNLSLYKSLYFISSCAHVYLVSEFLSDCWNVLTINSTFNLLLLALSAATVSSSPIMCPLFASFLRPCLCPQALYGSCAMKGGESLAVWALKGTSLSDNGTRVVCQKAGNTDAPTAVLHVYGKYSGNALYQGPYKKHKLILTFLSASLNKISINAILI